MACTQHRDHLVTHRWTPSSIVAGGWVTFGLVAKLKRLFSRRLEAAEAAWQPLPGMPSSSLSCYQSSHSINAGHAMPVHGMMTVTWASLGQHQYWLLLLTVVTHFQL
jgi:hypothetical protein